MIGGRLWMEDGELAIVYGRASFEAERYRGRDVVVGLLYDNRQKFSMKPRPKS